MISAISPSCRNLSFRQSQKPQQTKKLSDDKQKKYIKSFLKNTAETTPVLLTLTGIWSVMDSTSMDIPLKKTFKSNLLKFFLPVTIVSSIILSGIENKNSKK